MIASIETGGLGDALRGILRRASLTVSPTRIHLADRVLFAVAELAFMQLGVPGVLACCEYLASRCGNSVARRTSRQRTANAACDVARVHPVWPRDHETS
jgi:hypothetical protein